MPSDDRPEPESAPGGDEHETGPGRGRETWLIAAWPGMGSVALTAGSWLVGELPGTHQIDLSSEEFFDVEKVEVHEGVARIGWRPSCVFHHWRNTTPDGPDLLVFIGEAQPSTRGLDFCHRILEVAQSHGVSRVITFAAMATQMHPSADPRVFAVANDERLLPELGLHSVEFLKEGQINGLNGVLLAAAAELGVDGMCLLGEMPFFAVGVPNPGASVAVLEVFTGLSELSIDLEDLRNQAETVKRRLSQIFERMPQMEIDDEEGLEETIGFLPGVIDDVDPDGLTPSDLGRLESLFQEASQDRSRAIRLKAELDRLGVYRRYEDRFLDLFRQGN